MLILQPCFKDENCDPIVFKGYIFKIHKDEKYLQILRFPLTDISKYEVLISIESFDDTFISTRKFFIDDMNSNILYAFLNQSLYQYESQNHKIHVQEASSHYFKLIHKISSQFKQPNGLGTCYSMSFSHFINFNTRQIFIFKNNSGVHNQKYLFLKVKNLTEDTYDTMIIKRYSLRFSKKMKFAAFKGSDGSKYILAYEDNFERVHIYSGVYLKYRMKYFNTPNMIQFNEIISKFDKDSLFDNKSITIDFFLKLFVQIILRMKNADFKNDKEFGNPPNYKIIALFEGDYQPKIQNFIFLTSQGIFSLDTGGLVMIKSNNLNSSNIWSVLNLGSYSQLITEKKFEKFEGTNSLKKTTYLYRGRFIF